MLTPAAPVLSPAAYAREVREPIPDSIPRHGGDGRPKIRHADDPTQMSYFWRPSSFGDGIESTFLLDRREARFAISAMIRFPDLGDEIAAVLYPGGEEPADWAEHLADKAVRDELNAFVKRAAGRAGAEKRAALGTELHAYRDRLDREGPRALPFLGPEMWAALQAWTRIAGLFTWHGSEQFVVNHKHRTAGTYDAMWSPRCPMAPPPSWDLPPVLPGQRIVVDLKSGHWVLKYGEIGRVVQLTEYPAGQPYVHVSDEAAAAGDNGLREWPDGIAPRTDLALIPHVPLESPQDAGLLWVNLKAGAEILDMPLARRWDVLKLVGELILPAELPSFPEAEREVAERIVVLARAEAEQRPDRPTAAEEEMLDHDTAVIEFEAPCPRRGRGEVCADCDGRPAVLAAMRADALTAAGVEDGLEFVEPPTLVDAKATLLAARQVMFDRLEHARLLDEIRTARLPMTLRRLWEAQGQRWPSDEHARAATARWAELTRPVSV